MAPSPAAPRPAPRPAPRRPASRQTRRDVPPRPHRAAGTAGGHAPPPRCSAHDLCFTLPSRSLVLSVRTLPPPGQCPAWRRVERCQHRAARQAGQSSRQQRPLIPPADSLKSPRDYPVRPIFEVKRSAARTPRRGASLIKPNTGVALYIRVDQTFLPVIREVSQRQ